MNATTATPPACLTEALRLMRLGYPVLPINPVDKKPLGELVPNGLRNATKSESVARQWWRARPDANLAVETSGCCVVDVDPCDGKPNDWLASLDGALETPMMSMTPRGGCHLWFADPTRTLRNSTSKLAPNVDTRAAGGYVLVSPSKTGVGAYDWTDGPVPLTDLPVAPEWLVEKLKPTPPPVSTSPATVNGFHHSSADDRQTAVAALSVLDPSSHYDEWLKIGMALHSVDASLLPEWDNWSKGSDKYADGKCAEKWNGFTGGGGVGIGTLCHLADATGNPWRPVRPAAKVATSPRAAVQRLPVGTLVRADDRDNFGTVVSDDGGAKVKVHFVSPSGTEATVGIDRSKLKTADGLPVVPSSAPAIVIRPAGQLIGEFPEMRPAILEGLLRCGETANIIAAPKTGKSWLSMGLGLAVVTGRKWLDRFWTRRGKVLIVDNELHPETSASRLPRIAEAMGIQFDEYAAGLSVANLRGQLTDLNLLAAQLVDLERGAYSLIVLDAWYRFQPVGTDENSNGDVTALYNLLDSVADRIGSAFVCIHHTSKGNQSGKGVTDVGSGAGAQSRAPDTHLTIRAHEEDNAVVVEAAVRSFAPPDPFCLRWTFPVWTAADDLDPTALRQERPRNKSKAAPESGESPEDLRNRRDAEARQGVLDAYATFPDGETATIVREAAGMSGKVFGPINSALIRKGIVQACKVRKGQRQYDGFRLVTNAPGQVGQVGQNNTLSGLSDLELGHTRTTAPPLGGGVCPGGSQLSDAIPVDTSGEEFLSGLEGIDFEAVGELFPVAN